MLAFISQAPPLESGKLSIPQFESIRTFLKKIKTRFNRIFFPKKYITDLLPDLKDHLEQAVSKQLRDEFESALQKKGTDTKKARARPIMEKVQNFGLFLPSVVLDCLSSSEDPESSHSAAFTRTRLEETLQNFTTDLMASVDHALSLSDEEIISDQESKVHSLVLEFERFIIKLQRDFKSAVSLDCGIQHSFLMGKPHSALSIRIRASKEFSEALCKGIEKFTPNMEEPIYHQAYEFLKGRSHKTKGHQVPNIPVSVQLQY